ncbi:helix-turn-helix domain-containing protein [Streptomyces sp. NPDC002588]|uniref:helix-turn-helix domain-containing protein n=1 Tax=Streptomyces sp. NPDC002588 TaxID=3154419 RepID=UPI00331969B5
MAEQKPSPAPRPNHGVRRSTTHSGVTHVRTHQSGRYIVVGNHLAQHRELSLTAIGLATHILSLPEGAPVDIRSLADRFPEGRDRIAFALRELEAYGYLERVRERTEAGRLFTRTYAHHTPGANLAPAASGPVPSPRPRGRSAVVRASGESRETPQEDDRGAAPAASCDAQAAAVVPSPSAAPEQTPGSRSLSVEAALLDGRHDRAVTLLAGLRGTDKRLILSQRDLRWLAPAVTAWLDRGVSAAVVHSTLISDLPEVMRHPAAVLGYRLRELLPAPIPVTVVPPALPADNRAQGRPHPFQTCDGCERAFRAPHAGRCRDCRSRLSEASGPCRAA